MSQMLERTSFDTPTLPPLRTIISELHAGIYLIPEFQRPYVWRDEQRLALLDSIVKGLPIGSLLVWRSSTHELTTYETIAGIPVPQAQKGAKNTYLIDGHQRMSTLFGALVRPPHPRSEADARRWPMYYELGTSERPAFRLPPSRSEPPLHWLPMDRLLDVRALFKFRERLFQEGQDDLAEEAERIANIFKDYIIPVMPLITEDLDLVTDVYVRINSNGSDRTEAQMLRALTFLKGEMDTDKGFRAIKAGLDPLGWRDVPDQTLVNSLKAAFGLDVYRSSVRELNEQLRRQPDTLVRLKRALEEAVELLRTYGVTGWGALPYAYQLVTLAAIAHRAPGSLASRSATLRSWFWRTTYAEHFTGQTGGQIRREIDQLGDAPPGADAGIAYEAEVDPAPVLRKGKVRTKAFLLFLANLPRDPEARERRQMFLAAKEQRQVVQLFPGGGSVPGNVVLADPSELRSLREALRRGQVPGPLADEYGFPEDTLACLPDESAFVGRRTEILLRDEQNFIRSLGLRSRPAAMDTSIDGWDDDQID